jgi:hypothetical protein
MSDALSVLAEVTRRFEEAAERTRPVPEPTPPGPPTRLTVGMATYDDYDGVFFTVEAIHLYQELTGSIEFLVVDNHPQGPAAEHLKALDHKVPGFRYVPFDGYRGTAVRDLVFREATSDLVVCLDSHVLLRPGALARVVAHLDTHPDDFVHGPLLNEDGSVHATHFEPVWQDGMFGFWDGDVRDDDPTAPAFEIEMSGLAAFACRRDAWPGLNPRFRGFGSEEGYLQEKVRRRVGRVVCLPGFGYVHRFGRPRGPSYLNDLGERIRNYVIGWSELGWDVSEIAQHFSTLLDAELASRLFQAARREVDNPLSAFDAIFCLQVDQHVDDWPDVWGRLDALGVGKVTERFPALVTPENHHAGCARSHRAMIGEARRRGLETVLVVEEDAIFLDDTLAVMQRVLDDLGDRPWDLLYLGGMHWKPPRSVPWSDVLVEPTGLTCTHAVVYRHTAFDRLLVEIPEDDVEFDAWLERYVAIDQYLPRRIEEGAFRAYATTPRVASQPSLLHYENADKTLAERYTIR